MSGTDRIINLRVTFIGAVEHIRQIEAGLTRFKRLEDVAWTESPEAGLVHFDASVRDKLKALNEYQAAQSFFESVPKYFNQRAIIDGVHAVNHVGLQSINTLPTCNSRYGFNIIDINNIGRLITDQSGVERHHAVVSINGSDARLCKLDKVYPT